MIPEFNEHGELPPGTCEVSFAESAGRRPTILPIEDDREYEVAVEWRARLQACLDNPDHVGVGLDETTRADLLRGYELHLQDVVQRIAEYETARREAPKPGHAVTTRT
ncbi:MAG: hypothetical protein FJX75_12360 [Armatimonadetes bacterium]|nr:hypothetical protein [Armatimonadota bacterium]